MSFTRDSFHAVCKDAKHAETWYVSLVEEAPYYGGSEEGGWWGTDTHLLAYQEFPSEEAAQAAAEQVQQLAAELKQDAQREHGDQCLRELTWLEQRGLDPDFLPEPDGPSYYHVVVSQGLPEEARGSRHYS